MTRIVCRVRYKRGVATLASWAKHLVPGAFVLAHYQRSALRGDVIGGITVLAYLVPQVMAYAVIAGVQPIAGMWAMLPSIAVYALFGSSRQLSLGPESTTALMTAVVIGPLAGGDSARYALLAATLALIVGLLGAVCWALRLGFVADLLSQPVLIGYMAGIGVLMIAGQLDNLSGISIQAEGFASELTAFAQNLSSVNWVTLTLGVGVLVGLFTLKHFWPEGPISLVAVLVATVIVAVFDLQNQGVEVIGAMPTGLPTLTVPELGEALGLIAPAFGLLLVGYTDTVLTARSFASQNSETVDPNAELLALGLANVGASLVQSFPVSSSASRTALAIGAGARTQMNSLVALVGVVATLLFLGPLLSQFPYGALGALVAFAAVQLFDVAGFRRLVKFRVTEFLLALITLIGVLFLGVLYGVLLAVALSVAEMLYRVARPQDATLGFVPDLAGMHDVDDYPGATTIPGLIVYRYDSPLFFANAEDFRRRALHAADSAVDPVKWFILNAEANVEVDSTALEALDSLRTNLESQGIHFGMARVKNGVLAQLAGYGLIEAIGEDNIFATLPTAVEAFKAWKAQSNDPT